MPQGFKTPGVYITESTLSVTRIEGVATSISAFVGRAARGPVNRPVTVRSLGEYERQFGFLSAGSEMSYAVTDFFRNGGGEAVIVRLFRPDESADVRRRAVIDMDGTGLEASHEGAWGNGLIAVVSVDSNAAIDAQAGLATGDLFNLAVYEAVPGVDEADLSPVETHASVTLQPGPRKLSDVLQAESERLVVTSPAAAPPAPGRYRVLPAGQANDGLPLTEADYTGAGRRTAEEGLYALDRVQRFNLLCLPADFEPDDDYPGVLASDATVYCEARDAIFVRDPPAAWLDAATALGNLASVERSPNAALYFPRIVQPDPLDDNQPRTRTPSGAIAGVIARTDAARGVWKSPAGVDAALRGVSGLATGLTANENGALNRLGVNCLMTRQGIGTVIWGARTLAGSEQRSADGRYLAVVRTRLYVKQSLESGLEWVVFEPNGEPLWAKIRQSVNEFMMSLWNAGAIQGATPDDAWFVRCDRSTMAQSDLDEGRVVMQIGMSLLRPAEFHVLRIGILTADAP